MSFIPSSDFLLEVSKGNVPGHSLHIQRGHNPDVDSANGEDIWEAGGTLTYLTTASVMNIVSTSTSDASAGSGVRTVLVSGINASGAAASETVTMSGTTNRPTTGTYLHVNNITALTSGTAKYNVGNITAASTQTSAVICEMDAGEGVSQNSHYRVPLNKSAYLYQVEFNAAKTGGGQTPVVEFKGFGINSGGAMLQLFDKKLDVSIADELDVNLPFPTKLAAQTTIHLTAETDKDNTEVRSRMYLLIVDD
jgi:hypothetical protein